jgi:hypothetical protein
MNLWEVVSYHNLYDSPSLCFPANLEIHFLAHQGQQHPLVALETSLGENEVVFPLKDKQGLIQMVVHNDRNLLEPDEIWNQSNCKHENTNNFPNGTEYIKMLLHFFSKL